MIRADFYGPRRVWINTPSSTSRWHEYHARKGIAVPDLVNKLWVTVYFTEGAVLSTLIPYSVLEDGM